MTAALFRSARSVGSGAGERQELACGFDWSWDMTVRLLADRVHESRGVIGLAGDGRESESAG